MKSHDLSETQSPVCRSLSETYPALPAREYPYLLFRYNSIPVTAPPHSDSPNRCRQRSSCTAANALIQKRKNIITTRIDGSGAVIVESFGAKELDITLDGILVDMQHHTYPANEMRQLREMFEANTTFEVWDCDILADLGIEQIYFDKLEDLKVLEDYPDTVKFKMTLKSIKPVEFFF